LTRFHPTQSFTEIWFLSNIPPSKEKRARFALFD
jgi:hypothetical protein